MFKTLLLRLMRDGVENPHQFGAVLEQAISLGVRPRVLVGIQEPVAALFAPDGTSAYNLPHCRAQVSRPRVRPTLMRPASGRARRRHVRGDRWNDRGYWLARDCLDRMHAGSTASEERRTDARVDPAQATTRKTLIEQAISVRDLLFPILLVAVVLAVPILPFLGFGARLERRVASWLDPAPSHAIAAAMTVGLLAVDVYLPIPSSVVSTSAAALLGFWLGTAASWLGMTLGGIAGFLPARFLGRWAAVRLSNPAELDRIDRLSRRFGPLVIVLTRPIPVLAEASVLALGATDLAWSKFLVPLMLSNLGIAAVYSALGHLVRLPIALAASIAIPLLALIVARKIWPHQAGEQRPSEE
jgi:uncharacterized membrane protein YdjX (TVP38/TMEM64 family)